MLLLHLILFEAFKPVGVAGVWGVFLGVHVVLYRDLAHGLINSVLIMLHLEPTKSVQLFMCLRMSLGSTCSTIVCLIRATTFSKARNIWLKAVRITKLNILKLNLLPKLLNRFLSFLSSFFLGVTQEFINIFMCVDVWWWGYFLHFVSFFVLVLGFFFFNEQCLLSFEFLYQTKLLLTFLLLRLNVLILIIYFNLRRLPFLLFLFVLLIILLKFINYRL